MHGEWTPHAHLNKDVSEVFVSHQRRRSRKEVRSQGGRSRKKSQFARKIEPRQELPGGSPVCVPAPQISTADRTRLSPVSFYRESRLPPVLQMLVIQVVQMLVIQDLRSMTTPVATVSLRASCYSVPYLPYPGNHRSVRGGAATSAASSSVSRHRHR